jgi:hypothetical protein
MNAMATPGFTAEASSYKSSNHYYQMVRAGTVSTILAPALVIGDVPKPRPLWTDPADCFFYNLRSCRLSASLFRNVPECSDPNSYQCELYCQDQSFCTCYGIMCPVA